MPLNVRRFYSSLLLMVGALCSATLGQTVASSPAPLPMAQAPTSGDVMRERISKAKAFIVVRNYNAAIYELENIRKETADETVRSVATNLLMNSYLEQGDFKRAQDLLNESFNIQKTTKPNALGNYMAVAGQVVKGARNRAERYKALGLSVSDRMLPLEALNDLEKMRETLEIVVTQSKEIGQTPAKTAEAMGLLEAATTSRSMLGRDDYDARRWRDEVSDTREKMANSRSTVLSAITDPTQDGTQAAATPVNPKPVDPTAPNPQPNNPIVYQPNAQTGAETTRDREVPVQKTPVSTVAQTEKLVYVPSAAPAQQPAKQEEPRQEAPRSEDIKPQVVNSIGSVATPRSEASSVNGNTLPSSPVNVGPLIAYATKQTQPVYPQAAKTMRTTGIVKVEVAIDENGDVTDVKNATGPMMLQGAAKDAIKKWKFRPIVRDGQPVKAVGFINFNFSM